MSDFSKFSVAVTDRFTDMSKGELFVTIDGDTLWGAYLAAFPKGTNPIYRERTEHDCSCCRQFIKGIGNVVAVQEGQTVSVWDIEGLDYPYDVVAKELSELVRSLPITNLYRMSEPRYGSVFTVAPLKDGGTKRWNHFSGTLAAKHHSKTVDKDRGDFKTTMSVFKRGLTEFSKSAFSTVLELIAEKALYRGEEHLRSLNAFLALLVEYTKLKTETAKDVFVWSKSELPVARFRNTVMGTLIQDLSEGKDLAEAVGSFESKVDATNYKRTTALISPSMVKDAMKTIGELDLEEALKRRFAKISDVSVNNVLWVDRSVKSRMKDSIADVLMAAAKPKLADKDDIESISIEDFMGKIVPKATAMEVQVTNSMTGNFMSLTAPITKSESKLFNWGNDFAWSYEGNVADSIKERVKRAGGNVTNAKMRVSLSWRNGDDLDIHVFEPNGSEICFFNKDNKLDVDMNAGGPNNPVDPVENVSWTSLADGKYRVVVYQYNRRETSNVGFELEVESDVKLLQFTHASAVKDRETVPCLDITVKGGAIEGITVGPNLVGGLASKACWGVATETFVKVSTLMKSPNHWDGNEIGNKHWFFMLEGCKNEMPTRGIYNEFLKPELLKHRKVFEVLGDKTKCQPTDDQLSGVGFSSTKGESVLVRVSGQKHRKVFNINF